MAEDRSCIVCGTQTTDVYRVKDRAVYFCSECSREVTAQQLKYNRRELSQAEMCNNVDICDQCRDICIKVLSRCCGTDVTFNVDPSYYQWWLDLRDLLAGRGFNIEHFRGGALRAFEPEFNDNQEPHEVILHMLLTGELEKTS